MGPVFSKRQPNSCYRGRSDILGKFFYFTLLFYPIRMRGSVEHDDDGKGGSVWPFLMSVDTSLLRVFRSFGFVWNTSSFDECRLTKRSIRKDLRPSSINYLSREWVSSPSPSLGNEKTRCITSGMNHHQVERLIWGIRRSSFFWSFPMKGKHLVWNRDGRKIVDHLKRDDEVRFFYVSRAAGVEPTKGNLRMSKIVCNNKASFLLLLLPSRKERSSTPSFFNGTGGGPPSCYPPASLFFFIHLFSVFSDGKLGRGGRERETLSLK